MSELKATPGPWFITTEEGFFNICTLYCLPMDERTNGKGFANISSSGGFFDREYDMSDAHLIAAAPDYDEAMIFIVGELRDLKEKCHIGDDGEGWDVIEQIDDMIAQAETVMKKARGEA